MVRRYAHLAVAHLAPYAGKAGIVIANAVGAKAPVVSANDNPVGTNWSHQLRALKTDRAVSPRMKRGLLVVRVELNQRHAIFSPVKAIPGA